MAIVGDGRLWPIRWRPGVVAVTEVERYPISATMGLFTKVYPILATFHNYRNNNNNSITQCYSCRAAGEQIRYAIPLCIVHSMAKTF